MSDIPIEGEIVPHGAPRGRPSIYTEAVGEEICERLETGESLYQICADAWMPGVRTVMDWAKNKDDFRSKYMRAREAQAEYMDHLILSAAASANAVTAPARRVQIDAYKWRAAKLAPKVYGDKLDLTHRGTVATANVELPADQNEAARVYRDFVARIEASSRSAPP